MPTDLIDRLEGWKTAFGTGDPSVLEGLLEEEARAAQPADAARLIRLHETLLFLRAHPPSAAVARLADAILRRFAERVAALRAAGVDLAPLAEPEVSGIAGSSFSAVFSFEMARQLVERHAGALDIDWEEWDGADRLPAVLALLVPGFREDWPVEASTPSRQWLVSAVPRGRGVLGWLVGRLSALPIPPAARAALYDSLQLPIRWRLGSSPATRSRMRFPGAKLFCHTGPLLRRADVSLDGEMNGPRIPVTRLGRAQAAQVLARIVDTSAVRYRELYGFSYPDLAHVYRAEAGRGLEIYFFGLPAAWRLPLRAYHAGIFVKSGVPIGYLEVLSLFDRAEVGFNVYYTFREGESAWLYARTLHLARQQLGVTCFSVDPYQIGHHNQEAIDSGAFWFYRKLGFRPVTPAILALAQREERRLARQPGYRTPPPTLERLAAGCVVYEAPGAEAGFWDGFSIRTLALALEKRPADLEGAIRWLAARDHWSRPERQAAGAILAAKQGAGESRYLRLMQGHRRLREALRDLGCAPPAPAG